MLFLILTCSSRGIAPPELVLPMETPIGDRRGRLFLMRGPQQSLRTLGVLFLLNLLHRSRQDISRTHFAELRDALADEETYALSPLHRTRYLLHQQRLDSLRCVVGGIRLGSHIRNNGKFGSNKIHRR